MESLIKKALSWDASGLVGSRTRFLASGGWPLPIESLIKKALILEASGLGGSRARFLASGGWSLAIERLADLGCCVLDVL